MIDLIEICSLVVDRLGSTSECYIGVGGWGGVTAPLGPPLATPLWCVPFKNRLVGPVRLGKWKATLDAVGKQSMNSTSCRRRTKN